MNRASLISKTIENLSKLPDEKIMEVSDFAEFLFNKIENQSLSEGIKKLNSDSETFSFLAEDEVIYSTKDLKETYQNGKR